MDQTLKEIVEKIVKEEDQKKWGGPIDDREQRCKAKLAEREKDVMFVPVRSLKVVRDGTIAIKAPRRPITTPQKALAIFAEWFRDIDIEVAAIMTLDANKEYISVWKVADGNIEEVHIDPMKVFTRIGIDQASAFILAHNHPNAKAEMSDDDIEVMNDFRRRGIDMNRPMLDFMILAYDATGAVTYYSHKDNSYDL